MEWFTTGIKVLALLAGGSIALSLFASAIRVALGRPSRGRLMLERVMRQRHDPAADQDVAELRQTVERLSGEVAELQERLDFAERMLAQQRERQALPER